MKLPALLLPLPLSLALALIPLEAADKPNFILILTDDLGYGDLGCYGSEKIKTPHLDARACGSRASTPSRCAVPRGRLC